MVNGRARVMFMVRPGANTRTTVSVRLGLKLGLGFGIRLG